MEERRVGEERSGEGGRKEIKKGKDRESEVGRGGGRKICCRGPAPVDPGNSKGGRHWHEKNLFID